MTRPTIIALVSLLWASSVGAKVRTRTVEYRHGKTILQGYLAWDEAARGRRPGVLVVHEWWGINDYIRQRTEQLAAAGYVALAADIYGQGIRPKTAPDAGAQAKIYRADRALLRARARAGLDTLLQQQQVDPARVAAIGFCFGGTTALELARSGSRLAAVVSFHGGLDTPHPEDAKRIRARVLALHGADDPHVPPKAVRAFEEEMRQAGVDWQLISYGGAVHAFSNPAAGSDKSKGVAYDERAARRSWEAMRSFLHEVFAKPR